MKRWHLTRFQYLLSPLLVGFYPVLFVYARNMQSLPLKLLLLPLLFVLIVMPLLGVCFKLIMRGNLNKASFATSLFWVFFFTFGIFFLVGGQLGARSNLYLTIVWIAIYIWLTWALFIADDFSPEFNKIVLTAGLLLVAVQLFRVGYYRVSLSGSGSPTQISQYIANPTQQFTLAGQYPDIYYLVLDSYPRSDTLKRNYNYPNRLFDNFLKSHGFYLAGQSHANYNSRYFALASALNMSYLEKLNLGARGHKGKLASLLLNNEVSRRLKGAGYKIVNTSAALSLQENPHADINYDCLQGNPLVAETLHLTLLKLLGSTYTTRQNLRASAACTWESLQRASQIRGPKFVLNHSYLPGPPYIFDEKGNDTGEGNLDLGITSRWGDKESYLAQLQYTNKKVMEAINFILKTNRNSVIVVQSPYGTLSSSRTSDISDQRSKVLKERSRNYFAIYLPKPCHKGDLSPSMTNVNTFRLVFNSCFGTSIDLLPDKVYYTDGSAIQGEITRKIKD